jgi:2-methylaconitate cis-trans-isomerase PrpF
MRQSLPYILMRGGTSKGVFLRAEDLPRDPAAMEAIVLDIFGSPDRRQIDGLGGADKLTSKVSIMGRPVRPGTDITYLYGHVGITVADVDFNANCGNLLAAAGVYAIEEGYVAPTEGVTRVRIHNLNTDKVYVAEVPVRDGEPATEGDLAIDGVPGTGAPIALDFSASAGAKTGKLLPLGSAVTPLDVPGLGTIEVSVVDLANLCIYVEAGALGMTGPESPTAIDGDRDLLAKIAAVRGAVAHRVGLGEYWDRGGEPATPKLIAVQRPTDYASYTTGNTVRADAMDIVCRLYSSGSTSKALAATVTACTGAALKIPGTIPHRIARKRDTASMRLGHPSGVIVVEAQVACERDDVRVQTVKIFRTARRIAEGKVYLKRQAAIAPASGQAEQALSPA